MKMIFTKKHIPLIVILLLAGFLRFYDLGYSEFQDDEKKAFIRNLPNNSIVQFFLNQRKGPMQFIVTEVTQVFVQDTRNEFLVRLPFTIANLLSVLVFYLIIKELVKSDLTAFLGSLLFLTNGFVVGFSRIAQYQNLNILFSFLALYFFIKLSSAQENTLKLSLLGTLFFSLSLLSHWDAIFILIPLIYYFVLFLRRGDIEKDLKKQVILKSLLLGGIMLLPFLIPYIYTQLSTQANIEYFGRRVGLTLYPWEKHLFIFELYNPFVALYLLPVLALFSLIKIKRNWIYLLWFVINFMLIRFFMEKPGTHIYNYVLPLVFLAVLGIYYIIKNRVFFVVLLLPIIFLEGFLYFQSYKIFVDHTREYPWDKNEILTLHNITLATEQYREKEVLTFGFPHFRNWKQVNEIVASDPDNCSFITNEGKEIAQIYMTSKYGVLQHATCYYIAVVKRPFIIRGEGAQFAELKGKKSVYIYERDGESLLKLYKVTNKLSDKQIK